MQYAVNDFSLALYLFRALTTGRKAQYEMHPKTNTCQHCSYISKHGGTGGRFGDYLCWIGAICLL